MLSFNVKILFYFIFIQYLLPNVTYNDTVSSVEYTFEGNLSIVNFKELKLFNGEDLIFDDGIFKKIKIVSQGLLVNNTKDGEWMYFNDNGLVEKLVSYNKGMKLKVLIVEN